MCDGLHSIYQRCIIAFIWVSISFGNSNCFVLLFTRLSRKVLETTSLLHRLLIQSRLSLKWLNIVLDLNDVLCQCMERSTVAQYGRTFCDDQHIHSLQISILDSLNGVYCHPCVCKFLRFISNFAARIVIWSSMKRTTIEQVVCYLFHDLPPFFAILD